MRGRKHTPNSYHLQGDVAHLVLTNRRGEEVARVMIDAADLGTVLAAGRWTLHRARRGDQRYRYAVMKVEGKSCLLHRFLMGEPHGMVIDHLNHDTLDCRRSNLRVCTHSENHHNRLTARRDSRVGIRNVKWEPRDHRWRAYLTVNKKYHHLGYFIEREEAERAVTDARRRIFGDAA